MVKTCCVKYCRFSRLRRGEKLSLHRLPLTDTKILSKWLDFLGYGSDWKPFKHAAICSRHFKPTDFRANTNITRLLPNAVPSIKATEPLLEFTSGDQLTDENVQQEIIIDDSGHLSDDNFQREIITDDCNVTVGIAKMCRLCGKSYKYELKDIFDEKKSYVKKIYRCLHISLSYDENLPFSICLSCEKKLNYCEDFLTTVEGVQSRFSRKVDKDCDVKNAKIESVNESTINNENQPEIKEVTAPQQNTRIIQCYLITPAGMQENEVKNVPKVTVTNENGFTNVNNSTTNHSLNLPAEKMVPDRVTEEHSFKIPIKTETMTPCPDLSNNNDRPPNKKIEILQNITIDPGQMDIMSIKTKCYGLSSNILNPSSRPPNKTTNKYMDLKTMNLLSKSMCICKFCNERFVSKYVLNNHMKYLCHKRQITRNNNVFKCEFCWHTYKTKVNYGKHITKCLKDFYVGKITKNIFNKRRDYDLN